MTVIQFKRPAPLTPQETCVWAILASDCKDVSLLSKGFRVSEQTIRNTKLLKSKKAKRVYVKMIDGGANPHLWAPAPRFTDLQIEHIRESKDTSVKLGKAYGVAPSTIRMIKTGKTYVQS